MSDLLLKLSPDYLAFVVGCLLMLLGLFTPKRFAGIEMDWSSTRSALAVIIGILVAAFSFPQLRFWQSNTVNIEVALISSLKTQLGKARDLASGSHDNSSDAGTCSRHGGEGMAVLDKAIASLNTATPQVPAAK